VHGHLAAPQQRRARVDGRRCASKGGSDRQPNSYVTVCKTTVALSSYDMM
jgi:hypothetical protein